MVLVDFATGRNHPTGTGPDGHRVPWFTHAKSVEISARQIRLHLGGRENHNPNLCFVDVLGTKPFSQEMMMRGKTIHDAEGEQAVVAKATDLRAQRCAISHSSFPK